MERQVVVGHAEGLHARPAAEFVKVASRVAGSVEVCLGAKRANAKSLLSILSLGATVGQTVTLRVEGAASVVELDLLVQLLEGPGARPAVQRSGLTLQEILRQPQTWQEALEQATLAAPEVRSLLGSARPDTVIFTGCGSSYYLAIAAAGFFQEQTGRTARAVPASELVLSPKTYLRPGRQVMLFAFSRSGTTTETVAACRAHRGEDRGPVVAFTCEAWSALAGLADVAITLSSANDQSVVMTSSFSSMLLAAYLVSAALGNNAGLSQELATLPALLVGDLEAMRSYGETLGADLSHTQFVFLGIGPFLGVACEAMLKLKEMTQVPCEAYSPLDFRHGPISMVGPGTIVILLGSDRAAEQESKVLGDVQKLGGTCLALSPAPIGAAASAFVVGAGRSEAARSLLYLPILQCVAYYRAVSTGQDPDRPQHLSRVVSMKEDDLLPSATTSVRPEEV